MKSHLSDKRADTNSKKEFKELLVDLDISIKTYQILEFIFRQTMIKSGFSKFRYENEVAVKRVAGKHGSAERVARVVAEIRTWESSTGLDYGFETIDVHKFDLTEVIIREHPHVLAKIQNLRDELENGDLGLNPNVVDRLSREIQGEVIKKLQVGRKPTGKLISFEKNGTATIHYKNYEYFKWYIRYSFFVFGWYFNLAGLEGKFFDFLSKKIRREHSVPEIESFTARNVRDRWRNGGQQRGNSPVKLGLLDDEFLRYLLENQ